MAERFPDRLTLPPLAAQSPGRAMVKHQKKGHRAVPEDSATSAGRSRKRTNLHAQAGLGRLEQRRRRHAAAGAGRVSTTDEGIESENVRISIPATFELLLPTHDGHSTNLPDHIPGILRATGGSLKVSRRSR